MNKVTEIVELILKEIVRTNDFDLFEKEIFNKLSHKGYAESEIDSAFNYFNTRIISKNLLSLSKKKENFTIRILSEFEKGLFTPEAERYLLSYIYSNKLKWNEVENILYIVSYFNDIIDERTVKAAISEMIFSENFSQKPYIN